MILVRSVHPANTPSLIDSTLVGIATLIKLHPAKAYIPMAKKNIKN